MTPITVDHDEPAADHGPAQFGWFLGVVGLAGIAWWVWTLSKVQALIDDHVAANGPLPTSSTERAGLYSNGSPAEQQLSADLEAIPGLYPWGRGPLLVAALIAVAGFAIVYQRSRVVGGIGLFLTVASIAVGSIVLGEEMRVALDILE